MKSRLYARLQEVHPTLIEIIKKKLTNKKRAFRALFCFELSIKRKLNHHKQDILVHPGWHRRIVPKR